MTDDRGKWAVELDTPKAGGPYEITIEATFNLVKLTNYQALCLDGSHGAYYLYKGDPTKVILYFEGGGWCGGKD